MSCNVASNSFFDLKKDYQNYIVPWQSINMENILAATWFDQNQLNSVTKHRVLIQQNIIMDTPDYEYAFWSTLISVGAKFNGKRELKAKPDSSHSGISQVTKLT